MTRLHFAIGLLVLEFFCNSFAITGETACADGVIANSSWLTYGPELVTNPSFESGRTPWFTVDAEGWDRVLVSDELYGACGSWYAKINTNPSRAGCPRNAGVFQYIFINQTSTAALVVSAWSIGLQISGTYGSGYSIYADVALTDGTYAYGFYAPFDLNVTLWQYQSFLIQTEKPILSLYVYGLFRGDFVGTAYFDSFSVKEATVVSPNLIVNPSFDGGNSSDCSAPITGWTNLNDSSLYVTCPVPASYIINSPPGFIGAFGEGGVSGAQQRVSLNQATPRNITFSVYARITETTVAGAHLLERDAKLIVTYIDATNDTASVSVTDTTAVRLYTINFAPTKPIDYVDVQLRFDSSGYSAIVYWDDASLEEYY